MTRTFMGQGPTSPFALLRQMLRRSGSLLSRVAFGIAVFIAAGVVALATAMVGLLLAIAAIFMKFGFSRRPAMARAKAQSQRSDGVLEARRTARGWTVDK